MLGSIPGPAKGFMILIIMTVQLSIVAMVYVNFRQGQNFAKQLKDFQTMRECDFEFFKALETEINLRDRRTDFKAESLRLNQEKGGLLYVSRNHLDTIRSGHQGHASHS
jgi:hypothetical protein